MIVQLSVLLDSRIKQDGTQVLKLRVYYKEKTIRYPLIYCLTQSDYDKLSAKRVADHLSQIRSDIQEIEASALLIAKKDEAL